MSHGLIGSPTRKWSFSIPLCLILFGLFTFQMTMKGSKVALLLLLVVALEILLFTGCEADPFWGRRRRRRRRRYIPPVPVCSYSRPSSPRWINSWQQDFNVRCITSKKLLSQFLRLTCILCFRLRLLSPVSTTRTTNEQLMIWLLSKFKFKFRFHLSCVRTKNTVNVHTNDSEFKV